MVVVVVAVVTMGITGSPPGPPPGPPSPPGSLSSSAAVVVWPGSRHKHFVQLFLFTLPQQSPPSQSHAQLLLPSSHSLSPLNSEPTEHEPEHPSGLVVVVARVVALGHCQREGHFLRHCP